MKNYLLCLIAVYFTSLTLTSGETLMHLERFEYTDVQLTAGRLKEQLDATCSLYLNIPNKDLLKGFRERAGLPTDGAKEMGGWYSWDIFHPFGQFLSGLSRLYAATGNVQCKEKVAQLIEGWAETIESDGFFYYTHQSLGARHYVYEKIQAGLLDAYLFTGNEDALIYMSQITDWAIENLDTHRTYPDGTWVFNAEWYTLSENLYRAYEVTGEQKYFDFADFWEYPIYWDRIGTGESIFSKKIYYHAYSHLNCISGAAMAYKIKNEQKYLNTLLGAYDFFVNSQGYITGGFGPVEQLVPLEEKKIITNLTHNSFETQCGSWAGFKLSKYLLEFTGEGQYGDWIEKLLINGIGASIPMTDTGAVMYYSDYNCKRAAKQIYFDTWTCCTGTRPQAIADYVNLIYFKDTNGVYVNYFTPSTVNWNGITLEQQTAFPEEETTRITVSTPEPTPFAINLRKPLWLKDAIAITVNGEAVTAVERDGWFVINRTWEAGDKIEATLPMSFWTQRLVPDAEYPVAMAYGPVVLAVTGNIDAYPLAAIDLQNPGGNLIADPNHPMTWAVQDHPDWQVRGYYQLTEDQPYVLYVDPRAENVVATDQIHTSKNEWNPRGFFSGDKPGATIDTVFTGKGVRLFCYKNKNGGRATIQIDGEDVAQIDLYANEERTIYSFDFPVEHEGEHQIKVTIAPEKNEKSSGTVVVILGFEGLQTPVIPAPGSITYVDAAAVGANNGTNWANAYTSLQMAIENTTPPAQIWVAGGTYTPGVNRTDSFVLKENLKIYGGFTTNMTLLEQRDWNANETILSGEIQQDDDPENNAYHVLKGAKFATLNGFTVMGGNANGSYPDNSGGGIYMSYTDPMSTHVGGQTIINCTFRDNAAELGGGLYGSNSTVWVQSSAFVSNTAAYGGAVYVKQFNAGTGDEAKRKVDMIDCTFRQNKATAQGGAVYGHTFQYWRIEACRFISNFATSKGGALYTLSSWSTDPGVTNCVFAGNASGGDGGALANGNPGVNIYKSIFSGNIAKSNGGAIDSYNATTLVKGCVFAGNTATNRAGALHAAWRSINVWNSLFAGNVALGNDGGGVMYQYAGGVSSKLHSSTLSGNRAKRGGAITTYTGHNVTLQNSIVWGNSGSEKDPAFSGDGTNTCTYSTVQGGWSGAGTDNNGEDPLFVGGPSGTWTAVGAYDPAIGQTVLTDSTASWTPGAYVGQCLNANTAQYLQLVVVTNTANTITVWGDAASATTQGDAYQIWDYHLKSKGGRWTPLNPLPENWIIDTKHSPCIDAGDPAAPFSAEPTPNGERINIGYTGNTAQASMTKPRYKASLFLMR